MRSCGILLPVFSLPSKYGIGCFSNEAIDFINFLADAGQKYWQILPLVIPGAWDSPYQSPSTFAGNPLFIDLEQLVQMGLLYQHELDEFDWANSEYIDYGRVKWNKTQLLERAFDRCRHDYFHNQYFKQFCDRNNHWLEDYANYMSMKEGKDPGYYRFEQALFMYQWKIVKSYANYKGIKIIGDLPIYVSMDSADVYYNKHLFELENGELSAVAGCPPDDFSADGQCWGNPLYNWDEHRRTGYDWWIRRVAHCFELYDVVRLDHFRAFYDYYSIPARDGHARNGVWKYGPGIDLFNKIRERLGNVEFIAEDLGYVNQGVHDLMRQTGFPGMKILQYAFNGGKDNPYLPENISENYVVYTGTHDNNTSLGWYNDTSWWEREHLRQYIPNITDVSWNLADLAMSTRANLCIIQMQDFMNVDSRGRINTPGTCDWNWKWRMYEIPSVHIAWGIRQMVYRHNR